MKIRLGLLERDLACCFKVSDTFGGKIFTIWVKGIANILRSFVFVPEFEKIRNSKPKRLKYLPKLHSFMFKVSDGTEICVQTPKNHEIQRITWSSYKHHRQRF